MQQLLIKRRELLKRLAGLTGSVWLGGCGTEGGVVVADDAPIGQVPLSIEDPYPVVTARLEERDARLVLDSGADATVLDLRLAQALGLTLSEEIVPGSGGSGPAGEIRRAVVPRLAVGGALLREHPVYVTTFPREFPWEGVLGVDFLQAFAVCIDYERGRLDLAAASARAGARQVLGSAPSLPLRRAASGKLLVEAEIDGVVGWFSLDTGAGGGITLFAPAVERLGLRARWGPGVRMATGLTIGGVDYADCVRTAALQLGGYRLQRPVVELSLASAGLFGSDGWLGNIGSEVLRRFSVGLDASRNLLTLQPNGAFGQTFPGPRSGFIWRDSGQALQVAEVLADGPAAAAGLRVGDALLEVDGRPIRPGQGWTLRQALRAPAGTAVQLLTGAGARVLVLKELV